MPVLKKPSDHIYLGYVGLINQVDETIENLRVWLKEAKTEKEKIHLKQRIDLMLDERAKMMQKRDKFAPAEGVI